MTVNYGRNACAGAKEDLLLIRVEELHVDATDRINDEEPQCY